MTGAGSGIGRETALAFAREGAEVVVSDIDEASVKDTAAQIAARGGIAHAYPLDVADADAVERFAERGLRRARRARHRGQQRRRGPGRLLPGHPAEEYDRVLDINLGGVVNGCRSFARRLVDRGTGGHIVNVSSMAAYSPQQSMNAYCTSKAAVYMFGDCLRAELDPAGIGLTTICPGVIDTNIVSTTRFDVPAGKEPTGRGAAQANREGVRCPPIRPGQSRQGHRVRGQEEQADPSGGPRGLLCLRRRARAAAGDAQRGASKLL